MNSAPAIASRRAALNVSRDARIFIGMVAIGIAYFGWLLFAPNEGKTGVELGVPQTLARADDSEGDARVACTRAIEREAKYAFEWTDSVLGQRRFGSASAVTGKDGRKSLVLTGRAIKMQNGFSAWSPMAYLCTYTPDTHGAVALVTSAN